VKDHEGVLMRKIQNAILYYKLFVKNGKFICAVYQNKKRFAWKRFYPENPF